MNLRALLNIIILPFPSSTHPPVNLAETGPAEQRIALGTVHLVAAPILLDGEATLGTRLDVSGTPHPEDALQGTTNDGTT